MSRLDELIQELCPDGVEYKTLGELGKFYGGITGKSKDDFTDGNAKFITYKNVYSNPALDIDVDDKVKISDDEKQRTLEYGDVILTGSSETPDECGISSVLTQQTDEKLYLNSFCFVFRFDDISIMLPDFSKHLFRSSELRYQIGKTANGVTRFNVSKKLMEQVKLPVPPVEVQREIVHVLDSFTLLTAELTAELTARKKQYEFYRNKLLTNENITVLKPLGDICTLVRGPFGGSLKKECFVSDGYAVYEQQHAIYDNFSNFRYFIDGTKYEELKRFSVNPGDMIMSCSGTMGKIAIVPDDAPKGVINQALLKITVSPEVDRKYLKYCFENTVTKQMNDNARGGAIKNVASIAELKQTMIAVPPIEIQKRLVKVLDNFDAICSDLNIGLPAEIEARQKQYEFYRDALLTYAATGKIIPSQSVSQSVKQ